MTQALHLSILQDGVTKTFERHHFNTSRIIFQHNHDPKHTIKLVKQCLSIQNFDALTWPPQSPNLNPMEHVWALVKWNQMSIQHQPKECFNFGRL